MRRVIGTRACATRTILITCTMIFLLCSMFHQKDNSLTKIAQILHPGHSVLYEWTFDLLKTINCFTYLNATRSSADDVYAHGCNQCWVNARTIIYRPSLINTERPRNRDSWLSGNAALWGKQKENNNEGRLDTVRNHQHCNFTRWKAEHLIIWRVFEGHQQCSASLKMTSSIWLIKESSALVISNQYPKREKSSLFS